MAKFVNRFEDKVPLSPTAPGAALSAVTANKGHIIIGLLITNIHDTDSVSVTVNITDSATSESIKLIRNKTIPAGGNFEVISGKVVIDASGFQSVVSHCPSSSVSSNSESIKVVVFAVISAPASVPNVHKLLGAA